MTANIIDLTIYAISIACYGVLFQSVTERGEILGWYLDWLAGFLSPFDYDYLNQRANLPAEARADYDRDAAFDNAWYKILGGCAFCHIAWISLIFAGVWSYKHGYYVQGLFICVIFASVTTTIYQLLRKWTSY